MYKAFLDTNILLDMEYGDRPDHGSAWELLSLAANGELLLACGADSLAVFAFSSRRYLDDMSQLPGLLRSLMETLEVVPLSASLIERALDLDEPDLDDQIVHASFLTCRADVLVSRDSEAFRGLNKATAPQLLEMFGTGRD